MMRILQGALRGKKIYSPKTTFTRPTQSKIREALFNILQDKIENARFLDGFAGSGIIGFEALSRGANSCTFVDNSHQCVLTLQKNTQLLQVENKVCIHRKNLITSLNFLKDPFDIIYLDPPYSMEKLAEKMTNLTEAIRKNGLLNLKGILFLEMPTSLVWEPIPSFKTKNRVYGNTVVWKMEID